MRRRMAGNDPGTPLDALRAVLIIAHEMATKLAGDSLAGRILTAFAKLPEPDREPVLRVIERDATWCRIVEQTSSETGITVRPNPHASLYVHIFDTVSEVPSEPMQRDIDVIGFGIERFLHMLPLLFEEGVHLQWTAAARALVRTLDPELGAYAVRLAREVLALVEEQDPDSDPTGGA